ncbi:protein-tyrosine phosphatase-like protein [Trichoderma sp. SZMC 28011]
MGDEAQASFEDAHGQTLVSWATARKREAAIKPLLDEGANQSPLALPAFLSLSQEDIEINHRELYWAEQPREKDGLRYKQSNVRMDRYDEDYTPWAHNRVKLQVPENTYDYVNASPITLKSFSTITPSLRYIAMQGPTNPSFDHVWRMVAEQTSSSSPSVIVQLTEMVEKGEEYIRKCDQYFPMGGEDTTRSINNANRWGDNWKAQLTLDSKEVIADGAIEKRLLVLRISKNGREKETRLIWHFLYTRWPDSGVPAEDDLDSLLHLMTLSKQIEHSAPGDNRIIHCSDGVGRTGCFIALDHLLRELRFGLLERYNERFQGLDLVHHTVDVLRQQRWGMVESKEQYQFIYQVMRKRWRDKYGVADEKADNHE